MKVGGVLIIFDVKTIDADEKIYLLRYLCNLLHSAQGGERQ